MRTMLYGICLFLLAGSSADAQIVTGTTVTTGADGTVTQTQTTTASGVAATLAQANAQTALIGAATAAVPGSGIAPTTTPGTGSGAEEGSLLTAAATKLAARYLSQQAIKAPDVLVFIGASTVPDISPWLFFDNQSTRLLKVMQRDEGILNDIIHPRAQNFYVASIIGVAVAQKVLSYGYTSYQTAGTMLTPDDYMIDVALIEFQPTWQLYSQRVDITLPDDINDRLDKLDIEATRASSLIVEGQKYLGGVSIAPGKDAPENKAKANAATAAIANLTADVAAYTTFTASLAGGGSGGGLTLSAVLQAHAMFQALHRPHGGIAFIKVHSAGVGVVTKSNLITNLGSLPLYTSVGMVVSYVYYPAGTTDAAGKLILSRPQAGIFEIMTPYHTVGTVRTALDLDSNGTCVVTAPEPSSDAAKYCPRIYGAPPR